MVKKEVKENLKDKVFESALFEDNRWLFDPLKRKRFLKAVCEDSPSAKTALEKLENDLSIYLGENCFRNLNGKFFKEVEKLVSQIYNLAPEGSKTKEVLERILNLILDEYSKKKISKKD